MGKVVPFLTGVALLLLPSLAAAQEKVKMIAASVPTLSGGPIQIAKSKGYYDEVGLDVEIRRIGSAGDVAALIATNQVQAVGGALTAGFFNSVEKNIPVKIVLSRNTTPTYTMIMVRPDLKDTIKNVADLKGRTVAINSRGSIIVYQVGQVLHSGGLTMKDIETKFIPFPQMAVAFQNKAIDAAMMLPPLSEALEEQGLAVKKFDADAATPVQPAMISVEQMNMEWANANPKAAQAFVLATLRGVRDYCTAYHGGPNRAEVIKFLTEYSDVKDPAMIERMEWGARDPYGRVNEASVLHVQDFYLKEGLTGKKFAIGDLTATAWLDEANKQLGPFTPPAGSNKAGCR